MRKLNPAPSALAEADFVRIYGGVYEASPWVAKAVWPRALERRAKKWSPVFRKTGATTEETIASGDFGLSPDAIAGELDDLQSMQAAMREAVGGAGREKQMALVRAHPELAGRTGVADELTEESRTEQKGAGLDRCSPAEFAEFAALNRRYKEKFGFPFIIAVTGHTRRSILAAFRQRLENDVETEFRTALEEIHRIAAIRLSAMAV